MNLSSKKRLSRNDFLKSWRTALFHSEIHRSQAKHRKRRKGKQRLFPSRGCKVRFCTVLETNFVKSGCICDGFGLCGVDKRCRRPSPGAAPRCGMFFPSCEDATEHVVFLDHDEDILRPDGAVQPQHFFFRIQTRNSSLLRSIDLLLFRDKKMTSRNVG